MNTHKFPEHLIGLGGHIGEGHPEIDRRTLERVRLVVAKVDADPNLIERGVANLRRWMACTNGAPNGCDVEWMRLPWNKHPHEVTYGGQTRAWTEARVSVSHTGSRMDSAPPASKRRVRSGPNLHSGETHHCVRRPLCPRPQLVHDSAKVCSHVLFPGRLRPDPGVGPCMEQSGSHRFLARQRSESAASTPKTGARAPMPARPRAHRDRPYTRCTSPATTSTVPCASAHRAPMRKLLAEKPWSELRAMLVEESDEGQRLRSSHPFIGILTEEERESVQ